MEKPNTWLLFFVDDVMAIVHYFSVVWIWYVSGTLPILDNFRITKLEKCLGMPISCLSRGSAACQSCLSGKVIYSHQVEDSGQSIPFSHGDLSIIGYEKCINGWLKYLMTNKSTRMASPLHGKLGVPDLSIDHGYALRLGWPQTIVQAPFLSFSFLSPLIFICQSSWEILSKMVPR